MNRGTADAYALAESVRFAEDIPISIDRDLSTDVSSSIFLDSGLLISDSLLPKIDASIVACCKNLKLDREIIEAYVLNDMSANAFCYRYSTQVCRIGITSGLVELLDGDELNFVIGHEMGHFLLGHIYEKDYSPHPANVAFLKDSRAREISADRIGLIASDNLEASIRAMIKTQSGLSSQHIRFDVAEFIDSIRNQYDKNAHIKPHPNFYMRARFLLWASPALDLELDEFSGKREVIDDRILRDLKRYIDSNVDEERSELIHILKFWLNIWGAIIDGDLTKNDQEIMCSIGFDDEVRRFKNMLIGMNKMQVLSLVEEKALMYAENLKMHDRDGGASEILSQLSVVESNFNNDLSDIKNKLFMSFA